MNHDQQLNSQAPRCLSLRMQRMPWRAVGRHTHRDASNAGPAGWTRECRKRLALNKFLCTKKLKQSTETVQTNRPPSLMDSPKNKQLLAQNGQNRFLVFEGGGASVCALFS